MRKGVTKEHIAAIYKSLVVSRKTSHISVKDISEAAKVSRKTFYYHFYDKTNVEWWIFRSDIAEALCESFDEHRLVFPYSSTGDPFPALPFYTRTTSGIRSIDNSNFFLCLSKYFESNKDFYYQILSGLSGKLFTQHFFNLYRQGVYGDILYVLGGRTLNGDTVHSLTTYFTYSTFSPYLNAIQYPSISLQKLLPPGFFNLVEDTISNTIENYFDRTENGYRFFRTR